MRYNSYIEMDDLIKNLNSSQNEAVVHLEGPLLIIAGAGTGKTRVIAHRIAHLITSKAARPEEILAVTFTEKAANEMEERVDLLIPYSYSFVEISTFNSFGERVLRDYGHELGYYLDFSLLDEAEQAIFFRQNLFRFPLKYFRPLNTPEKHIREIINAMKRLKQEDVSPDEYLNYAGNLKSLASDDAEWEIAKKHQEIALVYKKYQRLMRTAEKIDFEDQVVLTVDLFRRRPSVLKHFQKKYKYILVDEFQDTNYIQFELLKLLAAKHQNLTVVGDDDQSIFRFRGASLSNILNFKENYTDCKKIVLTQNYRSTQDILDAAHQLIVHNNPDRLEDRENIEKALRSSINFDEKSIHLLQFDTLSHEADRVSQIIRERFAQGYSFKDMAVLVRRNADADPYIRALNMQEIPYRFSGSRGLYGCEEIRVLISFINALTDFDDSKSLFMLASSEVYDVDPYDLIKISNYAQKKHLSLHGLFKKIHDGLKPVDITSEASKKIKRLVDDLLHFVQMSAAKSAGMVLYSFLERSGYLKSLAEGRLSQSEIKARNIALFFEKVKKYSEISNEDSIHSFAQQLELLQQVGDNPAIAEAELEEDAVNILTVHKAKGLEFSIVFLVSLIADRFPGRERKDKIYIPNEVLKYEIPSGDYHLQEERRLFYVGMTRAKKFLYLTWARDYGTKRLKKISPFILEALDMLRAPHDICRASALDNIRSYSHPLQNLSLDLQVKEKEPLKLSFFKIADYLACPLRYKYRHLMKIPVLPHHNLVYGRVLHNVIHNFLRIRMAGKMLSEDEFIQTYHDNWINEGFLSREHEEMRKAAGEAALRSYYRREIGSSFLPKYLEKRFSWQKNSVKLTGRWDRIDIVPEGAVILDYKAAEVKDQKEADKLSRDSLQLNLYALSFIQTQKEKLFETRLHFLESDIIGRAQKNEEDLAAARKAVDEVSTGILAADYRAKPEWHNCHHCEFRNICPESLAY